LQFASESLRDQSPPCAVAGRLLESFARTGEVDLFCTISRTIQPWLERCVRTVAGSECIDRDEVVAAVLRRIYLYSSKFEFQGSRAFECWLSAIVRNAVKKTFRNRLNRMRSLDRVPEPADGPRSDPLHITLLREQAREYEEAWVFLLHLCARQIARTPREEHSVLDSHHCRGMSFREIAERDGDRPERIAGKVRRARGRFIREIVRTLGPWL